MSMPRWTAGLALLLALAGQPGFADEADADRRVAARPSLTLIIDDLGQNPARDRRVLQLPGRSHWPSCPVRATPRNWPNRPIAPARR